MTLVEGLFARAEPLELAYEVDPSGAAEVLDRLAEEIASEVVQIVGPVVYRLTGPEPAKATPMQYGGFFLERDRSLLERAGERGEVWLWVDAGADAYLDFVSDLPADVFAWDARATGFSLDAMRRLRSGRLCTNEPGADENLTRLAAEFKEDRVAV